MSAIYFLIGVAALIWYVRTMARSARNGKGSWFARFLRGLGRFLLHSIPIVGWFFAIRDGAKAGFEEAQRGTPAGSGMSKEEARSLLGVDPNASKNDVQEAYKRLMMRNHPDGGGTDYLAQKINEARDVLLKP